MEALLACVPPGEPADTVHRCYRRDTNCVPPQYILLPISVVVPQAGDPDPAVQQAGKDAWWALQGRWGWGRGALAANE
jgi:hypothetical protein